MSKQNTPFIVRVQQTGLRYADKPLVTVVSTKPGIWPAEWMDANVFPIREGQQEAYFICTKKGGQLRVHTEVRRRKNENND